MLGVCTRLGKSMDLNRLLFQILFVVWSFNSLEIALIVYLILNFLL